jgi:hypothetical protein
MEPFESLEDLEQGYVRSYFDQTGVRSFVRSIRQARVGTLLLISNQDSEVIPVNTRYILDEHDFVTWSENASQVTGEVRLLGEDPNRSVSVMLVTLQWLVRQMNEGAVWTALPASLILSGPDAASLREAVESALQSGHLHALHRRELKG